MILGVTGFLIVVFWDVALTVAREAIPRLNTDFKLIIGFFFCYIEITEITEKTQITTELPEMILCVTL